MYIKQAKEGLTDWWRYILTFIIVVAVQFIGSLPLGIIVALNTASSEAAQEYRNSLNPADIGLSENTGLILMMLPMVLTFFALVLSMQFIHGLSLKNVFTSASRFRWKNFMFAFVAWGVILAISEYMSYLLNPQNYVLTYNPESFYKLVVIALLMIPLQAGSEELYLRGNLLQGIGLATNNRLVAVLVTSIIFGLLHITNPEVREFGLTLSMTYYISFGLFMAILVVFDGGLEMPLAIHAINNIFGAVFVGYKGSVLKTPALFHVQQYNLIPVLILFGLGAVFFILVAGKVFRWNTYQNLFKNVNP